MENEQKQAIRELATLLHEQNLSEIEYEANGVYLRVAGGRTVCDVKETPVPAPLPVVKEPIIVPTVSETKKNEVTIVSPMVGVVYLSKDPTSPVFAKIGDKVSVGQTVCLIEAMKTFNPIKSDKTGTIKAILVETGSPVEYNQPLFLLD